MLGYIKTQRDDLRICDFRLYKQQYCALCQGIGKKYGIVYRLILSYDMVFLALVLENFETEMTPLSFKCPTNPFKKINTSISNNVIEYCAFINYYLSVLKLEDDIIDAYEDYNEDMQNGNFNLLQNIMKEDDSDNKLNAHKKIAMINKILILKMEKSFHEITWNKYKEILYNIVSLVCTNTYFKILHEKYPEIESIIRCI